MGDHKRTIEVPRQKRERKTRKQPDYLSFPV